uniref:Immunoglobulin V-set domain-containing protein n=1 Tax=Nothobranchius furzeri TaxID=105023 RepID=A0A8C6L1N2_NOTFU
MEEPGWIQMFLLLTMLLQLPGEENCNTTFWSYIKLGGEAQELVGHGQVKYNRSNALSLAGNCSLVLRNISAEDAGLYFCLLYERGYRLHPDAPVYIFVVTRECSHTFITTKRSQI